MKRDKSKKIITVELPYNVWVELHDMAENRGLFFHKFMQFFIMGKLDEMKEEK
jgi:hypothetical protein